MRLAGQTKMGYYPTPLSVVELIRSRIHFPPEPVNVFDPCAGEGLALECLVKDTKAVTFGIELDLDRSAEAEKRIDHFVQGACERVEITPRGFGLLWLNPPYDDDGEGERKEFTFLRDTFDALVPGGLLVYIIPKERLSKEVAALLASNFRNVKVDRFPDPEFGKFRQIVVTGIRNEWSQTTPWQEKLLNDTREGNLLPLEPARWREYTLPPTGKAFLRLRSVDPEELVRLAATSPLLDRLREAMEPPTFERMGQPPTRLHTGHLGLLLSAGRLNGLVGKGEDRHIVVGKPGKAVIERNEIEEDAEGRTVEVHRRLEIPQVTIKILHPTGEIRTLS